MHNEIQYKQNLSVAMSNTKCLDRMLAKIELKINLEFMQLINTQIQMCIYGCIKYVKITGADDYIGLYIQSRLYFLKKINTVF